MHKTASILLSLFFIINAIGYPLSIHFCTSKSKEFISITYLKDIEKKCCNKEEKSCQIKTKCCKTKTEKKDCCKDEHKFVKFEQDYLKTSLDIQFFDQVFSLFSEQRDKISNIVCSKKYDLNHANAPPGKSIPFHILHESFLI